MILGYPWHEILLYFFLYSFAGWLMETCYCSIKERRLVPRGFLYGPICPIYGTGVVLMILFFTPLKFDLVLFYIVAVVVMTSWEYFVGWFLETTTHIKYWDYSDEKFNLKGRVCLWVALVWGLLSYVVIFWIHPPVERLYDRLPMPLVYALCGGLGAVLIADAAFTIRQLALISRLVVSVTAAGDELRLQAALGKAELSDKLSEGKELVSEKLSEGKELVGGKLSEGKELVAGKLDQVAGGKLDAAREKYSQQLALFEKYSRRFRRVYSTMKVDSRYRVSREDLVAAAELALEELKKKNEARKAARAAKK